MNRNLLSFAVAFAVIMVMLAGCHPGENAEQLKAINRSLEFANDGLKNANNASYEELQTRPPDVNIAIYAEKWALKAKRIKSYADSVKHLIKNIKSDLISQSENLKKENVPVIKQLYDVNGLGGQLLNTLIAFKDSCSVEIYSGREDTIQSIVERELSDYLKRAPLLPQYRERLPADQLRNYKKKWLEESFGNNSTLMAMIMLNKIESDVLTIENAFIEYCKNYPAILTEPYDHYMIITTLSSSYVKAGQSIEVYAGVGSITDVSKPRFTINGKDVELDKEGAAAYKFVASGKPGKHTIPVRVELTKIDGSKVTTGKVLQYIIAEN